MNQHNKYFVAYLAVVFGLAWSIIIGCSVFSHVLTPLIGELSLTHPLIVFVLYLPSFTGISIYFAMGRLTGLKLIFAKLIPRKQDWVWFPILFLIFVFFALCMRFGSLWLGVPVPEITDTPGQMLTKALWNFIEETGLLGGIFGWIGFLLPYLQGKLRNNVYSAVVTGLLFGLWVLPGYGLTSMTHLTSYCLYVGQLMAFITFASYIFNATEGNLTCYLFAFWLAATGSHIQIYYFNTPVQIMEISFLCLASLLISLVFKKGKMTCVLQTFPEYVMKNKSDSFQTSSI